MPPIMPPNGPGGLPPAMPPRPMAQPGAGAPPPGGAPGAGGPQQLPPEMAQHIDPNNQMQMQLMQRVDKLSPQDAEAINTGVSPPAAQALKKILPELGFLIDMIGQPGGGAPGGAPPGAPGAGGGEGGVLKPTVPPAAPGGGALPRPGTRLGGY